MGSVNKIRQSTHSCCHWQEPEHDSGYQLVVQRVPVEDFLTEQTRITWHITEYRRANEIAAQIIRRINSQFQPGNFLAISDDFSNPCHGCGADDRTDLYRGSSGRPIFRLLAAQTSRSIKGRYWFPTIIRREQALHFCPWYPKAELTTPRSASSGSASLSRMIAFLPPISAVIRFT